MISTAKWYRAMCFDRPIGPWRQCGKQLARDLIEADLASYDEYGRFFITVPGGFQVRYERVAAVA